MKRILWIVCAGWMGVAAALVAGEPTPRPDPALQAREIGGFSKQDAETGGIVFTGSSSIRLWAHLKDDFPGLPVVNRGFGGSVANDLIVYFDTVVARHEPRLLVTYTGSNDLHKGLTVEESFDDYTRFLEMARERFPELRVVLTSVKIARRRIGDLEKVHALNSRLEDWAGGREWVRFLDCTSYLADAGGQPVDSMFREDQLHLSPVGYAHWLILLDPVLREEWGKVPPLQGSLDG